MKNYYDILGLKKEATQDDIKMAFRKLSIKFHPDKNNGDEFLSEMFKNINEANETLSNVEKRKAYDFTFFKSSANSHHKSSRQNHSQHHSSHNYGSYQNASNQDDTQKVKYKTNDKIEALTAIYLEKNNTAVNTQDEFEKAEKIEKPRYLTISKVVWVAVLLITSYWIIQQNFDFKKYSVYFDWIKTEKSETNNNNNNKVTIEKTYIYKLPNVDSKIIGEIENYSFINEIDQTKYFFKIKFINKKGVEKQGYIKKISVKKNE